jgi:hypothetical protein
MDQLTFATASFRVIRDRLRAEDPKVVYETPASGADLTEIGRTQLGIN